MPSYTYECTNENCKNKFTLTQSIHEEHQGFCPKCSVKAKRIYTPINSVWNCGGMYGKGDKK